MIAHILKDKYKVAGDINSLNLLILQGFQTARGQLVALPTYNISIK